MKAPQRLSLQGFWAAFPVFPSLLSSSLHLTFPGKLGACEGGKQGRNTAIRGLGHWGNQEGRGVVESRLCSQSASGGSLDLFPLYQLLLHLPYRIMMKRGKPWCIIKSLKT